MKIKTKKANCERILALPTPRHKMPMRPSFLLSSLIRVISIPDMLSTRFKYTTERMDEAGKGPWLILMNHSSFIDLEIAYKIFYPKPFCTVCTHDAMVGKSLLMRFIGCIPTQKFVSDSRLITDMKYALHGLKTSVLMFPEAGYSFDGRATALPRKLGVLFKLLKVPVIYVQTYGAFARDPLYNGLQKRKVDVSAHVKCLLTTEEIASTPIKELDRIIDEAFSFDNFAWQSENNVEIDEPFRADYLNRLLYKCPACGKEGEMEGKGTSLTCHACGKTYEMDTLGRLCATEGETEFSHIPDWYEWEREEVKKEISEGTYSLDIDVDIMIMTDYKALYKVGEGHLTHNAEGFRLVGCDGQIDYSQSTRFSHSLNADYLWYEIGDVICVGDADRSFYCFPKSGDVVAKTRLATEELYKISKRPRLKKDAAEAPTEE